MLRVRRSGGFDQGVLPSLNVFLGVERTGNELIFLPVLGVLAYMITRPQMTEQDQQLIMQAKERTRRIEGFSSTDEIAKAKALLDDGTITEAEYAQLKQRALA